MRSGTYIGNIEELKGETALILLNGTTVKAQFDDVNTGFGYSWHEFNYDEFELDPEEEIDD